MARHTFSFNGGEYLTTMGACWFISYCYYENIDKTHTNWKIPKTFENRCSVYKATRIYHKYWLEKVDDMDIDNLNKNKIGLSGYEVKKMAKTLLGKMR